MNCAFRSPCGTYGLIMPRSLRLWLYARAFVTRYPGFLLLRASPVLSLALYGIIQAAVRMLLFYTSRRPLAIPPIRTKPSRAASASLYWLGKSVHWRLRSKASKRHVAGPSSQNGCVARLLACYGHRDYLNFSWPILPRASLMRHIWTPSVCQTINR